MPTAAASIRRISPLFILILKVFPPVRLGVPANRPRGAWHSPNGEFLAPRGPPVGTPVLPRPPAAATESFARRGGAGTRAPRRACWTAAAGKGKPHGSPSIPHMKKTLSLLASTLLL